MKRRDASLMVLGWHNVRGTWCFPSSGDHGPRGLEAQFKALRGLTNVVQLGAALRSLEEGRPLPPRALAITFDDGYRDNLDLAGPMLRRLGLPATCFLVPGILSGTVTPWWERLAWAFMRARARGIEWSRRRVELTTNAERFRTFRAVAGKLKTLDRQRRESLVDDLVGRLDPAGRYVVREQFLDWDGARALADYFDLGSHSSYHTILANEPYRAQEEDLVGARRELRDRIGGDFDILAYPNGRFADFDGATMTAAGRAGHSYAITTQPGWNTRSTHRYQIRRWVMNPERGPVDLLKIVRDGARRPHAS